MKENYHMLEFLFDQYLDPHAGTALPYMSNSSCFCVCRAEKYIS